MQSVPMQSKIFPKQRKKERKKERLVVKLKIWVQAKPHKQQSLFGVVVNGSAVSLKLWQFIQIINFKQQFTSSFQLIRVRQVIARYTTPSDCLSIMEFIRFVTLSNTLFYAYDEVLQKTIQQICFKSNYQKLVNYLSKKLNRKQFLYNLFMLCKVLFKLDCWIFSYFLFFVR